MLKRLKTKLKNNTVSNFFNKVDLERLIKVFREILEDLIKDVLEYRDDHSKIHKIQNIKFKDIEKRIKHVEKRIKNLELKK